MVHCIDPAVCACAQNMGGGFAYDYEGRCVLYSDVLLLVFVTYVLRIIAEKSTGIYECNYKCSCHKQRCKNRLVGRGLNVQYPLEVFRCKGKGWGLRCKLDIPLGVFVMEYCGEILQENVCEAAWLVTSI